MLSFWIDPDSPRHRRRRRSTHGTADGHLGSRVSVHVVLGGTGAADLVRDPEVQAGQLGRLLEMMSVPTVKLGIIPLMTERTAVASAGFWIFDDSLAALETPTASIEVTRPQRSSCTPGCSPTSRPPHATSIRDRALIMRALGELTLRRGNKPAPHDTPCTPLTRTATSVQGWAVTTGDRVPTGAA